MNRAIQPRNGYHDRDAVSKATSLVCTDESLTVQSQKDEADINTIVRNFGITGQLPQSLHLPSYGDFEGALDYHTAQNLIAEARTAFLALPSGLRAEFDNDPGQFLAFVEDPANCDQLLELGIERVDGTSSINVKPPATAGERVANQSVPDGGGLTPPTQE